MTIDEADKIIDSWLEEDCLRNDDICKGIRLAKTVYGLAVNSISKKLEEAETELELIRDKDVPKGAKELKGEKKKRKAADHPEKVCESCGKTFKPKSGVAKYCDTCRTEKKREQTRLSERKRQKRIHEEKAEEKETFDAEAITKDVNMAEAFARELAAMEG